MTFLKRFQQVLWFVLLSAVAFAQQDTIPTFGAGETHEIDTINLATLVPVLNISVVSKPGAWPFSYTLTAAQTCVGVSGSGGGISCNGGLRFAPFVPGLAGSTLVYTQSSQVQCNGQWVNSYSGWKLFTSDGLNGHPINPSITLDSCATSFTQWTIDGSGYNIQANGISTNGIITSFTVTAANGHTYSSSTQLEKDAFGNAVSMVPTGATTDTLGAVITNAPSAYTVNVAPYVQWNDPEAQKITFGLGSALTTSLTNTCEAHAGGQTVYPIVNVQYPDQNWMPGLAYEEGPGGYGTTTGRVASFILRTGGQVSYTYPPPCNYVTLNGGGMNGTLTRTTQDGTTTYTAATSNNITTTTVLDPGKNKTVYVFSSMQFLVGKDIYQNTGTVSSPAYTLISSDTICYNNNQSSCRSAAPSLPVSQRDVYHTVGGMTTSSRVSETFDTTYGNRLSVANYDFGASNFTTKTAVTYGSWNGSSCAGVGSSIHSLPCDVLTTDSASHSLAETHYTYNSKGALTTLGRWSGTLWITTSFVPNANGTTASSTNELGYVTTYGYGTMSCNGLLPTSILSGGLSASAEWDCNGGEVINIKDANQQTTLLDYDEMFRLWQVWDPLQYATTYTYQAFSSASSAGYTTPSGTQTVQNHTQYVDGLGRPLVNQTQQGPNSTSYDTVSQTYGFSGPNWRTAVSAPCTQTADTPCTAYTAATVDPLGRPMNSANPLGGTIAYTYLKQDASITVGPAPASEHLKTVQTEYDGLGRVVSTCALESNIVGSGGEACNQVMGGNGVLTSFQYTFAQGTSTVTATRGSESRVVTKDALGRTISETTPEAGTVRYVYDSWPTGTCGTTSIPGKLMAILRASGKWVCFLYNDPQQRLTDANGSGLCRRFRYDSTSNGLFTAPGPIGNPAGRMVEAETDNCSGSMITDEWFSYDADGRLVEMWEYTPFFNRYDVTNASYFPNGALWQLSGNQGITSVVNMGYGVDGEGRISTAQDAGTGATDVAGVTYNAAGQPLTVSIGLGTDEDVYNYDVLGHMTQYQFFVGSASNKGVLNWNPNGSLGSRTITDGFSAGGSESCTFSYDDTARLVSDNCGSVWSQTFTYDQYDNLKQFGSSSFTPGYNTSNQITGMGYTYDADGNETYGDIAAGTWDAYGKLLTNGNGSITTDAFGRTVSYSNGGDGAEILYSPVGSLGSSTYYFHYYHVPLPGGGMLSKDSSTYGSYIHQDYLGSARVASTIALSGNGAITYDRSFSPYGVVYNDPGVMGLLDFAGNVSDLFSETYDTPNRELTHHGRWLSPDPAHASWNAYAYVTDPNSQVDTTGLYGGGEQFHSCSGDFNACNDLNGGDWGGSSGAPSSFTTPGDGYGIGCPSNGCDGSEQAPPTSDNSSNSALPLSVSTVLWGQTLNNILVDVLYNAFDMRAGCDAHCSAMGAVVPAGDPVGSLPFAVGGIADSFIEVPGTSITVTATKTPISAYPAMVDSVFNDLGYEPPAPGSYVPRYTPPTATGNIVRNYRIPQTVYSVFNQGPKAVIGLNALIEGAAPVEYFGGWYEYALNPDAFLP